MTYATSGRRRGRSFWAASAIGTAVLLAPVAGLGAVQVSGTPETLRVVAQNDSIEEVLVALRRTFGLSWQAPSSLDKRITGTYEGSLNRVLARVLDGYNFVVKANNGQLAITVLGVRGGAIEASKAPSAGAPTAGPRQAAAPAVADKAAPARAASSVPPVATLNAATTGAPRPTAMPFSATMLAEGPGVRPIVSAEGPSAGPAASAATVAAPQPQPSTVPLPLAGVGGGSVPVVRPSTALPMPRS